MTQAQNNWYQKNREMVLARQAETNKRLRTEKQAYVRDLKESTPCSDCGNTFPYYVTQFDHIGTDKIMSIADMISSRASWAVLKAEIAKCELVCANCHAERTHNRMVP
jgi:hypothetical protein